MPEPSYLMCNKMVQAFLYLFKDKKEKKQRANIVSLFLFIYQLIYRADQCGSGCIDDVVSDSGSPVNGSILILDTHVSAGL